MWNRTAPSVSAAWRVPAVCAALLMGMGLLALSGAPPVEVLLSMLKGAVGSWTGFLDTLVIWSPLMLVTAGLLIAFAAGLWNIGAEGQIVMGAVFATGALRMLQHTSVPPAWAIAMALLAGIAGGWLWAAPAGLLKTFGGVHEIFGGLGLNFIATAITLWLVFDIWKRPGTGSMSGTEPFPPAFRLPTAGSTRFSAWAFGLGCGATLLAALLLRHTRLGLRLRAVGHNPAAAGRLMGKPAWRVTLAAFSLAGLFAGLAGAVQVVAVHHRLIPSISSGYGFLGLLVALLANYRFRWAVPVAWLFAVLTIGGIQLPILYRLDSSLAGVLQGVLVLGVLLLDGVAQRHAGRKAVHT